jgi:hypothetical protein
VQGPDNYGVHGSSAQYVEHEDHVATLAAWIQDQSGGLPWTADAHEHMLGAAEHVVAQQPSSDSMADAVLLYVEFRSRVLEHLGSDSE